MKPRAHLQPIGAATQVTSHLLTGFHGPSQLVGGPPRPRPNGGTYRALEHHMDAYLVGEKDGT